MKEYSKEAQMLLDELSDKEIKQLRKDYPFRHDRDAKIQELGNRGAKKKILSEISGLSDTSVCRICKQ